MCGICGFNFEDKNLIRSMNNSIYHRGPDDSGYFTDSKVSIGMRRLSVIDLHTGHQPQHNENEDIWIVYNGEIYNFKQIKCELENYGHQFYSNSDTEVLIHAYEEWGINFLNMLKGQFSFCIYDSNKNIFVLARDPLGLKPLYYYLKENKFIFASEIKSILCHDIERKLDKLSFNYFVSLRYTPFNLTLFEGINKLPAASFLIYDLRNNKIQIQKYWDVNFNQIRSINENLLGKELLKLIENSVKMRLISDVPLGVFLSGGIDSTSIVAIMSNYLKDPVKTFSIGFEKGATTNEIKYARYVSDYYNTDHKELIIKSDCYNIIPKLIWHLDDLIADPAIIPVFYMAKLAKGKITVALTGDGADEIFAGYANQYWLKKKEYLIYLSKILKKIPIKIYHQIPSYRIRLLLSLIKSSESEIDRFFRHILNVKYDEMEMILPFKFQNIQELLKGVYINNLDIINQYVNYDIKYQLPNLYNMKTDKITMAASLEARIPYLDKTIVEWSTRIPSNLKLKNNIEKYILKLAVKDLVPPKILKREKSGFGVPVNMWLKTEMNDYAIDILERLMKRKTIIRKEYVEKLLKKRKSRIYEYFVWTLMVFELWYETFMEQCEIKPIKI